MNATPPIPPEAPRTDRTPYLFVAPLVVYLLLFQGYPLLQDAKKIAEYTEEWMTSAQAMGLAERKVA